jgi:hypothetical protein
MGAARRVLAVGKLFGVLCKLIGRNRADSKIYLCVKIPAEMALDKELEQSSKNSQLRLVNLPGPLFARGNPVP